MASRSRCLGATGGFGACEKLVSPGSHGDVAGLRCRGDPDGLRRATPDRAPCARRAARRRGPRSCGAAGARRASDRDRAARAARAPRASSRGAGCARRSPGAARSLSSSSSTIRSSAAGASGRNETTESRRPSSSGRKKLRIAPRSDRRPPGSRREPGGPRIGGAEVRRHHDQRHAEVDEAAERVGQPAFAEHAEQEIERGGVGLLDLVEQHDRERLAPDAIGEAACRPATA